MDDLALRTAVDRVAASKLAVLQILLEGRQAGEPEREHRPPRHPAPLFPPHLRAGGVAMRQPESPQPESPQTGMPDHIAEMEEELSTLVRTVATRP